MKAVELNCTIENMAAYGNHILEPWRLSVSSLVNDILHGARELEARVNSSLEGCCELERRVNILADEVMCLKTENQRLVEEVNILKSQDTNPCIDKPPEGSEHKFKHDICQRSHAEEDEEFLHRIEKLIGNEVSKSMCRLEAVERRMNELENRAVPQVCRKKEALQENKAAKKLSPKVTNSNSEIERPKSDHKEMERRG